MLEICWHFSNGYISKLFKEWQLGQNFEGHCRKLGIFNSIEQAKSYAFKVDQTCPCSICTIMSSSSDPICIEANTDNDAVNSPR